MTWWFGIAARSGSQRSRRRAAEHAPARHRPLVLLVIVLIEEEMELIKRGAGNLPVMFLVQVAKRHRVGQQLIEIVDALFARVFRQGNRHSDQVAERLDLVRVLPGDGRGTLQNRVSIECRLGHGGAHFLAAAASAVNSSRPNAVTPITQPPSPASVRSTHVRLACEGSPQTSAMIPVTSLTSCF